jgi:mono/diheme cytochrome c family protein
MTKRLLGAIALAAATACGGSSTTTTTPAPASGGGANARPSANTLPSSVTPAMIAMGDSIFHARGCRNCHGQGGAGAQRGPALNDAALLVVNGTYNDYVRVITDGVPAAAIKDPSHTSPMPARGGARPALLTDDQIKAVAGYVFTLRKQ